MLDTTVLPPNPAMEHVPEADADGNADTRAPVGLDAGAPQVTDAAVDEGGWHGGAEEQGGGGAQEEQGGKKEEAPVGAQQAAPVVELGLDEEQQRLAREAMERVDKEDV